MWTRAHNRYSSFQGHLAWWWLPPIFLFGLFLVAGLAIILAVIWMPMILLILWRFICKTNRAIAHIVFEERHEES